MTKENTDLLPATSKQPRYNLETAMKEANDIISGKIIVKSYLNFSELMADVEKKD